MSLLIIIAQRFLASRIKKRFNDIMAICHDDVLLVLPGGEEINGKNGLLDYLKTTVPETEWETFELVNSTVVEVKGRIFKWMSWWDMSITFHFQDNKIKSMKLMTI